MDKNYYNSVSDFDLQRGGYYFEKIVFFEKILSQIEKRRKERLQILDLACNDGYLGKIYSKYGNVFGIDLNEKAAMKARENGIDAVCGDVFDIERIFSGKKFNVIVAGDIIEHVYNTDLLLQKIYLALEKNGVLLLSTPNLVSLGRRIFSVLGKNPFCEFSTKKNGINVGHIRYYTFSDLEDQLKEAGFGNIHTESDTANIPLKFIDKLLVAIFPRLGREILVRASKI